MKLLNIVAGVMLIILGTCVAVQGQAWWILVWVSVAHSFAPDPLVAMLMPFWWGFVALSFCTWMLHLVWMAIADDWGWSSTIIMLVLVSTVAWAPVAGLIMYVVGAALLIKGSR